MSVSLVFLETVAVRREVVEAMAESGEALVVGRGKERGKWKGKTGVSRSYPSSQKMVASTWTD
jgi:hypothetical protein